MSEHHLFERALGARWVLLPEVTRRIHTVDPSIVLAGEATVDGAENLFGRLLARAFGFPKTAATVPARVTIERVGETERWARRYPTRVMRSVMMAADPSRSTVEEKMGPFRFLLRLEGSALGIDMAPEVVFLWGAPLPLWILLVVVATERADADGRHLFDVHISRFLTGRLVHYCGWLRPVLPT